MRRRAPTPSTTHWTSPDLREGVIALALQRVAAVPVLATVALVRVEDHRAAIVVFGILATLFELAQLRILVSDRRASLPLPALLFLDVGMIAVGVALAGGGSAVAYVGLLTIFTASFAFPPRYMAGLCLWAAATSGGVVLAQGHGDTTAGYLVALAFTTLLCVNAARVREHTTVRLRELAAFRGRVIVDTAEADARDRRRISQDLHDRALQTMLAARQELDEAAAGDADALGLARDALHSGLAAVRELVYDLDPAALAGSRLPDALQTLVARTLARHPELAVRDEIACDGAGPHDELLYDAARELVRAAVVTAGVGTVTVGLSRDGAEVCLTVEDDGPPVTPEARPAHDAAVASTMARVNAAGGTLTAAAAGSGGLRVVICIADDARRG